MDPSRLPFESTWPLETKGGAWYSPAGPSFDRSTMRKQILSRFGHCWSAALAVVAISAVCTLAPAASRSPKFYRDDPIQVEPETQDASKAAPWSIDLFYDLMLNQFTRPGLPPGSRAA